MVSRATRIAREEGFGVPEERVVITAGVPLRTPGKTNMLRVARIGTPGNETV
jgi:pyruvate kinase